MGQSGTILSSLPLFALLPFLSHVQGSYYDDYANSLDTFRTVNAGPLTTVFTPPASCLSTQTAVTYGRPYLLVGCEGPYGNECCPDNWKWDRYFSPGQCPSGYKTCTLPTSTQRSETTAICCPSGFDCGGKDTCSKTFNSYSTITYTDPTLSVVTSVYGITATPIQIRFRASQSDLVPIPTDSLALPEDHSLSKKEKIGIGIGVPAAVVLLSFVAFYGLRYYRRTRAGKTPIQEPLGDNLSYNNEPPPAYDGSNLK
ncbi:hypothetical protein N7462_000644 [Penicillium macrosclerotiorum]|uniref:uncharacterized protein n=1 Tax=Penicillium macrosclerotiorum TaxID=303699 RepID=UPI002549304C|nr:uncharacterized protein N7462_000644 [Penicillium macrosclerotiorum]KAJ5698639.1 hypothetical protein N7462_000644 [Penicillium macrosclerotiorum]